MNEIKFIQITSAYPTQYLAFSGDKQVAYIRLRGGVLFADAPDFDGETIFEHKFENNHKGTFDNKTEENRYLEQIKTKIREWIKMNPNRGIIKTPEHIIEEFFK